VKLARVASPDELSPDALEREHSLSSAITRYDELRMRDALAAMAEPLATAAEPSVHALTREEALEMLALGEVVIRKAGNGRQAMVRSARGAGASWNQIGLALGSSKQAAWEAHNRWAEEQSRS
jgi:hypothetical protein